MSAIQIKFFFITWNNSVFTYFLFKYILSSFFSYKFKIKFFFIVRNNNVSAYLNIFCLFFYKFKIIYLKFLQISQFVIYFIKYDTQRHVTFFQCHKNLLISLEQKILSFDIKNSSIEYFRNLHIFFIKKI